MKKLIVCVFTLFFLHVVNAQEIQARFSIMSGKVSTQVDKKVFQTLQTALTNFINNRKWTPDNYQDADFQFQYVEFQPIEFNENRIQGSNSLTANITALVAYYVNLILGMDYDSFAPRGGDPYFQKAQFIVNNAPESGQITGWKA